MPTPIVISCFDLTTTLVQPWADASYLPPERQLNEAYPKRPCLWTGGGFQLPEPKAVVPILGSKMHSLPDSKGRANLRSTTPTSFARAVFEANYLVTETNL